ncbi:MAG: DNA repair protein RecN [Clostridia bacterium]|nr:DNA repair protein RecN [Clostridia bacterium]
MLSNLKISDIAIIKEAVIDFDNGLNVLTGETGAGKSIIIDAINAILGERTSRELIRTGSNNAEVSAFFENINNDVVLILNEFGVPCEEDNSLLISRKISLDGKNICKINGSNVTVSMLKRIGQSLINVHGQMDNHNLLNEELHYTYIDSFAENNDIVEEYLKAYNNYLTLKRRYDNLIVNESEKARKIDLLTYQIKEIEDAGIKIGEWEELEKRKKILQNAEQLLSLVNNAVDIINGNDNFSGVADMLNTASNSLVKASVFDETLNNVSNTITEMSYNIADCASELNSFLYSLDVDPNELDIIEERLDILFRLSKKYGQNETEILDFLEKAQKELDDITFSDKLKEQLEIELNEKYEIMDKSSRKLSANRQKFGEVFVNQVKNELLFLDMASISFKIVQNRKSFDETGADEIYFLISANAGEEPKPLSKIASGGELSRIMLAIKNVLASKDNVQTLIFDEVDTGVSGRAAQKIGIKLKEVSKNRQVLCVTHLAQIACFADNHFLISKSESENKTYTKVEILDNNGRIHELSRIIGGIESTQLSLDAAAEMIENAKKY